MRPSTWFHWHQDVLRAGARVLDLACGSGRHAIAAAQLGADVVAIDHDPERMETARAAADERGVSVTWKCADLSTLPLPERAFDVVMAFNYLDRRRMKDFLNAVKPGGFFIYETFLEGQIAFGWGPTSEDHLLRRGELSDLVKPFEVVFAREVIEAVDSRTAAVASVVAKRRE